MANVHVIFILMYVIFFYFFSSLFAEIRSSNFLELFLLSFCFEQMLISSGVFSRRLIKTG